MACCQIFGSVVGRWLPACSATFSCDCALRCLRVSDKIEREKKSPKLPQIAN